MLDSLPHLATRVFETPLMIHHSHLSRVLQVLGPRFTASDGAAFRTRSEYETQQPRVTSDGIAIIPVVGTLVQRGLGVHSMSGLTSYESLRSHIEDAATDPAIRAILLDVDSGGGEANGVFDLADFIYEARALKPIWAAVNETAFSAAYAIASAADLLYIPRTGGVGSIGVIAVHLDESAAEKQAGLKFTEIVAGSEKADYSPHRPLSDEAAARLQGEVNRVYEIFLATVSRNRAITPGEARRTEAGLYYGAHGIAANLADRIGTIREAEAALVQLVTPRAEYPEGLAMADTPEKKAQPIDDKPVVNLSEHREEGVALEHARVTMINDLCALSGKAELAAKFISEKATIDTVRKHLLEAKAEQDEKHPVSTAIGTPDSNEAVAANNYGWDKQFERYHSTDKGARTLGESRQF